MIECSKRAGNGGKIGTEWKMQNIYVSFSFLESHFNRTAKASQEPGNAPACAKEAKTPQKPTWGLGKLAPGWRSHALNE